MEKCLKVSFSTLDVLNTFSKILNGILKVHQSCMHQTTIEIIYSIIWFEFDRLLKLGQGVINLIQHHHTVASIRIVLRLVFVKSYGRTKIIHSFLIVTDCHKSGTSVSVILCMCGPLIAWWSRLQTCDGLRKRLDGWLCKLFVLLFIVPFKQLFGFIVFLLGLFLFLNLLSMVWRLFFLGLWFWNFWSLHNFIYKKNKFYKIDYGFGFES